MTNGPPSAPSSDAPPIWQMWRDLAEAQARTSQSVADQGARLAAVERSVPELASRLDGRFSSVEAQISRQGDHLAQQDQAQATFRLEVKSALGSLQAAEGARAIAAKEAAERAAERAAAAQKQASEQRTELRRWAMQTVASMALTLPGVLWPLIVTRPLALRLGVPAGCITLVLCLAAWAWMRSRH